MTRAHLEHAAVRRPGHAVLGDEAGERRARRSGRSPPTGTAQSGTPPSWKPLSSSHLSRSRDRRLGHRADHRAGEGDRRSHAWRSAKYGTMRRRRSRSGDAGVVMAAIIGARFRGSVRRCLQSPGLSRPTDARPPAFGHPHRQERGGADRGLPAPRWPSPTNGSSSIRPAATTPRERARRLGAQVVRLRRLARLRRPEAARPRPRHRPLGASPSTPTSGSRPSWRRASARRSRPRRRPAAYELSRLSRFCGRWIRHGDWYPDRVLRLFRRDRARFSPDRVHERVVVEGGPPGRLEGESAARHHADPRRRPAPR